MGCFTKMCDHGDSKGRKYDPEVTKEAHDKVKARQETNGVSPEEADKQADQVLEMIGPEAVLEIEAIMAPLEEVRQETQQIQQQRI